MRAPLFVLTALFAAVASAQEVPLGKPIDDGIREFVIEALKIGQKDNKAMKRMEPFALGVTGWKMRGMAPFLYSQYEASQFKVAALGVGAWDLELGKQLSPIADRAKPDEPVVLTEDEQSRLNLGTIAHAERFTKQGGLAMWEYFTGAALGELGTSLTLWVYMQGEESLAAELSSNLRGLGDKAKKAPESANKGLVASLKGLGELAREKYTRADIEKIAAEAGKAMRTMVPAVG